MDSKELNFILQEGEGYTIEFKESINSDLPKEMAAFANSSGGRIFIGIDDSSKIKGVVSSNSLVSQIQDAAGACDPSVPIRIEHFENVIIVHVKEGMNKPYRCTKGFYIRTGANSQKMTTREITEFIQTEGKVRFDEIVRDDVDYEKYFVPGIFNRFLELTRITKNMADDAILQNLGVLVIKNHKSHFNNAGLLLFCERLTPHLYFANITCALYKGVEKLTILDKKDFAGDLISNIEDTILFLKKHLNLRYEIKTLRRDEILEIPEVALREAVVNAVCHRDYFEKGANVMVEIFDDRVQITNPGGLPKSLTMEKFGTLSVCRNPLIASLLQYANYIEKMGTGIYRIRKALKDADNPEPFFDCDAFFTIIFKRSFKATEVDSDPGKTAQETTLETTLETTPETTLETTPESVQKKIITMIRENPGVTRIEMARIIGLTLEGIKYNISKMIKAGLIKHEGPTKSGYWQILKDK
jgi:ATP-dependent DNA helicase RecG